MKALGYAMIVLAIALALLAGFTLYGEIRSLLYRGCAEISDCSGLISVMVIMGCALVAAAVMGFAGMVLVRR